MDLLTAPSPADRLAVARDKLESLRRALERERSADTQELAMAPDDRGEDTTASQHPADVASDLEGHEFTLTRALIDTKQIRDVEDALGRIRGGTYGACVDCGRPIPDERLEVRPEAARDVECERRYSKRVWRHR